MKWTLQLCGSTHVCRAFNGLAALRHAVKHFLNPKQQWEQLACRVEPAVLNARLTDAGMTRAEFKRVGSSDDPAVQQVLEEIEGVYLNCVDTEITTHADRLRAETGWYRPREAAPPFRSIWIQSPRGLVLAARLKGGVSDLQSALRPIDRQKKQIWSPRRFDASAHDYVMEKIRQSDELRVCMGLPEVNIDDSDD